MLRPISLNPNPSHYSKSPQTSPRPWPPSPVTLWGPLVCTLAATFTRFNCRWLGTRPVALVQADNATNSIWMMSCYWCWCYTKANLWPNAKLIERDLYYRYGFGFQRGHWLAPNLIKPVCLCKTCFLLFVSTRGVFLFFLCALPPFKRKHLSLKPLNPTWHVSHRF